MATPAFFGLAPDVAGCGSASVSEVARRVATFPPLIALVLLAVIYLKLLGATGTIAHVTLFEAAMGPQIGGAIVATQYGLDPPLVTLMVGIGSVAAFLTLPLWWYALQAV